MHRVVAATVVVASIALFACQPQTGSAPVGAMAPLAAPAAGDPPPFDYEAYKRDPAAMSERQVQEQIVDRTRMVWGAGHGTQISYSRPDGATFLWYPGNRTVLPGQWMTKAVTGPLRGREQTVISLCYKYGDDTYNPVTGRNGGDWTCYPAGIWLSTIVESRGGDIFGLSRSATPPFVLARERMTLQALLQRAGGPR